MDSPFLELLSNFHAFEKGVLLLQCLSFTFMLQTSFTKGSLEEWFAGINEHVGDMEGQFRSVAVLSENTMIEQPQGCVHMVSV